VHCDFGPSLAVQLSGKGVPHQPCLCYCRSWAYGEHSSQFEGDAPQPRLRTGAIASGAWPDVGRNTGAGECHPASGGSLDAGSASGAQAGHGSAVTHSGPIDRN